MGRIDKLLRHFCPDGVEYKKLGEIGSFTRGSGIQKKDFVEGGRPCIHYGQVYTCYGLSATKTRSFISKELYAGRKKAEPGDLVIATTSENEEDVCKCVAWLGDEPCAVSGDAYIFSHEQDSKYVAYLFCSDQFQKQKKRYITGTKVLRVSGENMAKIELPFPPLDIQREVVRVLDSFAELETELEARKAQYAHYRDLLLSRESLEEMAGGEVSIAVLGDIAKINTGQKPSSITVDNGRNFPYVNAGTTYSGFTDEYNTEGDTVTTPSRGQGGIGYVGYQAGKFWCGPLCYRIRSSNNRIMNRYLFYTLQGKSKEIVALMNEGGTPAVNAKDLKRLKVDVPPLEVQRRVVDILDRFDALTTSLADGLPAEIAARRQQYEYYRDKLLDFPRKEVA